MTFVFVALTATAFGAFVYFGFIRKDKSTSTSAPVAPAPPHGPQNLNKP